MSTSTTLIHPDTRNELPTEMLAMMQTLRHAEAGARVVQAYDSLLGQVISTLGRVRG